MQILRFSSCSKLHTVLNWNIVKSLHEMQTFHQDFSEIRQKLPVFQPMGRLHGLGIWNEWCRRRTATFYVHFGLGIKIFLIFSSNFNSHDHFREHRCWFVKYLFMTEICINSSPLKLFSAN